MQHQVCKCDDKTTRNYYRYYDTPDGVDVEKKIMVTTRYGIIVGLIAGTYDVLMYSHAVGFTNIMRRYARHAVPLGLIGATFAAVANSVQHARHEDDAFNYLLGGLACGPLVALYVRNGHGLVAGGVALGIAGFVKKRAVDAGFCFFPRIPHHMNTITGWRHDYTVVEDPKTRMQHTCGKENQ